jgi:hypothetical protein
VLDWLGHGCVKMTATYTQPGWEDRLEAAERRGDLTRGTARISPANERYKVDHIEIFSRSEKHAGAAANLVDVLDSGSYVRDWSKLLHPFCLHVVEDEVGGSLSVVPLRRPGKEKMVRVNRNRI